MTPLDKPATRPPRVTIHDVAKQAGVSIGTVSKALNKGTRINADTRLRVAEVARSMGFRPNDLAQSLHRGQSMTVGMISNDNFGRFTMPILEGLESVLLEQGMAVFMCNATDNPDRERRHLEQLMGKQVDGLVFTARRADRRPSGTIDLGLIPTIFVFSRGPDERSFCLLPDDEDGAYLATRHLIRTGRRWIAHVTGPTDFEAVKLRQAGYGRALAEGGLPQDPRVLNGSWSEAWGRAAVAALFDDPATAPDGIIAGNDQIARGILDALRDRGIDVPTRVGVIGFDNWGVMAEAARPALTSVDMNLVTLGEEAGRRIIRMIAGEQFHGVERLPCTLVVRQSCGGNHPVSP